MTQPKPGGGFPAFIGQTVNVGIIVATTWSALTTPIGALRWLCWVIAGISTLILMATAAGILKGGRA